MIANFKDELKAFRKLLRPDCKKRILFFHGESGIGKTTLLQRCLSSLPKAFHCVEIQIRNSDLDVKNIVSRMVSCLDSEEFPRYRARLAAIQGNKIEMESISIAGQHNQLTAVINSEPFLDAKERSSQLLDAWLEDLGSLETPLLIAFDTYENASAELRGWIEETFLVRIARTGCVRILIAGQEVPETHNILNWSRCCVVLRLTGIPDFKHWLPVVRSLRRHIPHPLEEGAFLDLICSSLEGKPHLIMQLIEGLPRRKGAQ